MKSLEIKKKILLLNTEKKEKVNVYTFVDLEGNETSTVVGVKADMPLHKPLLVSVSIRINKAALELRDGSKKYINDANLFITAFEEVKK